MEDILSIFLCSKSVYTSGVCSVLSIQLRQFLVTPQLLDRHD